MAFSRVPGLSSCVIYAARLDIFDATGKLLKMTRHLSLKKAKPLGLLNGSGTVLWGGWWVFSLSVVVYTCSVVLVHWWWDTEGCINPAGFTLSHLPRGRSIPMPSLPTAGNLLLLVVACHVGLVEEDKGTAYFSLLRIMRSQVGGAAHMPELVVRCWKEPCLHGRAYFCGMLNNRGRGSRTRVRINLDVAAAEKVTVLGLA